MRVEFKLKEIMLREKLRVAVAESCTGGMISARIVNVPGSSEYFVGGIVAYDNIVKTEILGVDRRVIANYGAVSEEVAFQMVSGVKRLMSAECGISTTGVAGPGKSDNKPEGLVYIGISVRDRISVYGFVFRDKSPDPIKRRNNIRRKAAKKSLQLLIGMLKEG